MISGGLPGPVRPWAGIPGSHRLHGSVAGLQVDRETYNWTDREPDVNVKAQLLPVAKRSMCWARV